MNFAIFVAFLNLGTRYGNVTGKFGIVVGGTSNGFEGGAPTSLYWIVNRQLAEIEAMVMDSDSSSLL